MTDSLRLRRAYEDEKIRTREWGRVVARLYVQRIDTLYAAENAQTLRALQSLRFHALTGQRRASTRLTSVQRID
jgi:plasmid maintenance system killer protein